jgi:sigma-B regulation protein RsbQ
MYSSTSDVLARSNVNITGQGQQAIVLLHCMGGNQNMWQPMLPTLEQHYQVVLLDLVGFGNSDKTAYSSERHGTIMGHAHDLLDVLQALNLKQVVFIGHSIGAIVGVLAAIEAPERFASLVLISPSPRFLNGQDYTGGYERADIDELLASIENDYLGWACNFAPVVVGADDRPDVLLSFTNSFVNSNPEVVRHFARVTFLADFREDLPLLTTPSLIVQSARDVVAPLAVGHYLNEHLANSHIAIIDTSGHCPHLTATDQTLAAIEDFLHCELMEPVPVAPRQTLPHRHLTSGY